MCQGTMTLRHYRTSILFSSATANSCPCLIPLAFFSSFASHHHCFSIIVVVTPLVQSPTTVVPFWSHPSSSPISTATNSSQYSLSFFHSLIAHTSPFRHYCVPSPFLLYFHHCEVCSLTPLVFFPLSYVNVFLKHEFCVAICV